MKKKNYKSADIIAMEFCMDIADLRDYRYQYGRSDKPIYAIGNTYYCASPLGKPPAKHREIDYEWVKRESSFAESLGWQIWECNVD